VAEIGGNHNGDQKKARLLVQAAKNVGAGAVKFQAYRTKFFLHPMCPYRKDLAREELSFAALTDLVALAHDLGLLAGLTVFGPEGLDLALKAKADYLKISSGDLNYHQLIKAAGQIPLPLVISTGASFEKEVAATLVLLPTPPIVLQCASLYPAPQATSNLAVLAKWLDLGRTAGFSDHCLDIIPSIAASFSGAVMIEKHFTLDKSWPGGDNFMSASPDEFASLRRRTSKPVDPIIAKKTRLTLKKKRPILWGQATKKPQPGENPRLIRRWAIAAKNLVKGQKLSQNDVIFQRTPLWPTPLLGPVEPWAELVLVRDLAKGEPVARADCALTRVKNDG
jgi:N-acetylneuraminate synthase/N,N'-diacetyllegionaminate synthase